MNRASSMANFLYKQTGEVVFHSITPATSQRFLVLFMRFALQSTRFLLALPVILLSAALSPAEELTIAAVGDIMLAGTAAPALSRKGFSFPFETTRGIFSGSDIAVGNLEAPITGRGIEFTGKRFRFRSPPETAVALKKAGFSVVTLANNHMLDYGATGLMDTLANLGANGIRATGAGNSLADARRPAIIEVQGKRLAFLSYSLTYPVQFFADRSRPGTAPGLRALVTEDIAAARRQADHVIVSFHWGRELADTPQPYQVRAARNAIDAGADLVLGHHPHVLQGIERYRNGVIFYSLGNFAFGSRSRHADRSIIARITLDRGVTGVEIIPLNVLNREVGYQPMLLRGKEGKKLVDRLNRLSAGMGAIIMESGGKYLLAGMRAEASVARR
jgi:poly-gamma-glutamate synthesis protein (capsule biosynthesis protein)